MELVRNATQIGWDCHRKFSRVSLRDAAGQPDDAMISVAVAPQR